MLYQENGEWKLCPYKVKYEQHEEVHEQYTDNPEWWYDFEEKWDHTIIIEIIEVEYTDEQKSRLKEIQGVEEGLEYYAAQYVKSGLFPDELNEEERLTNHPMQLLQRKKEDEQLGQYITESQLRDIEQGQKNTELELRIMMMEAN